MPEEAKTDAADKAKSTLLNVVDRIAGAERGGLGEAPSAGGGSSTLPVAIALLGVVVIGFSILGIMLVMARRKAAKLAAQVRKLEEEKEQIIEDQKLASNKEVRVVSEMLVKSVESDISRIKSQISVLRAKNAERVKTLSAITDWDDFVVVDKRAS